MHAHIITICLCIHRYNTHTHMNLNLILYTLGVQQNIVRDEFNPAIPNNITASSSCISRRVLCKQKLEVQFLGSCLVQNKYYNKIKNNYWVTLKLIYKWMFIHLILHKECTRLKKNQRRILLYFCIIGKCSSCFLALISVYISSHNLFFTFLIENYPNPLLSRWGEKNMIT